MKRTTEKRTPGGLRALLAGLGLITGFAMFQPGEIQAAVSGGATIFNEATVSYSTPTLINKTATGSATVTVLTKAAAPYATVTPTSYTTGENSTVTYSYAIINRSNGVNNLAVPNPTPAAVNLNAPTSSTLSVNPFTNMWGGVILNTTDNGAGPGYSTISLPAGTKPADGITVAVVDAGGTVYYYTVSNGYNGILPSPGVAEVPATARLTPTHGTTVRLDNVIAPAGTVVGEYRTTDHTLAASTLTGASVSGTYTTNITVTATDSSTATASYTTKTADNNETITTVLKTPMTVLKTASPNSAKPGDVVTYTIEVINNTSAATTAATIADPVSSAYITYNAGTTKLNTVGIADVAGACPLIAGIPIKTAGEADGVILPGAANKAIIEYKVTVKP